MDVELLGGDMGLGGYVAYLSCAFTMSDRYCAGACANRTSK